ncbi:hypothetical protein JCM21900_006492 [Sporobolomyces salmonicolor]
MHPPDPFQDRSTSGYQPSADPLRDPQSRQLGVHRSNTADSGLDDILGAYGDSPSKTRFPSEAMSRSQTSSSSQDAIETMPILGQRSANGYPKSSTRKGSDQGGRQERSTSRPQHTARSQSNAELDLIDRLDISGLYGGGGFVRHDGPYAAATASRNQGSRAPINAFDPSALSLAPPPQPKGSRNISPRAQATLAAMEDQGLRSNDGPYGAARASGVPAGEVSMGFPSKKASGKGQQLIEIYGMRDAEAWEDFGSARYEPGGESGQASRESVVPAGVNKEDRMQRAQSIWDIEATLRAGKPVGQAPPPVPVLPSEWSTSSLSDTSPGSNKPKRSKSLAARFRAGRKNPTNPLMDEVNEPEGRDAAQAMPTSHQQQYSPAQSQPTSPVEDRRMQYPPAVGGATVGADLSAESTRNGTVKFDESAAMEQRPSGLSKFAQEQGGSKESAELGRRPSGLKRLFSKKGKVSSLFSQSSLVAHD